MKNFCSKEFKMSLVVIIILFIVGLLVINLRLKMEDDIYGEATVKKAVPVSNNDLFIKDKPLECATYGSCYDRTISCPTGGTCLAKAFCHPTLGCAVLDCCGSIAR